MRRFAIPLSVLALLLGCQTQNSSPPSGAAPSAKTAAAQTEQRALAPVPGIKPAYPLPEELAVPGKADEFDDFRAAHPQWYAQTRSPASYGFKFRALREWEPMQVLYITYSDYLNSDEATAQTIADVVVHTVLDAQTHVAVVVWADEALQGIEQRLLDSGLTQAQIDQWVYFDRIPNDAIWFIDYGPVPLVRDDGAIAFSDFRYYHGRALDDALPTRIGWNLGVDTFRMPVSIEGGNFQSDGAGTCFVSQRGLQYAGLKKGDLNKYWEDYLGCHKLVVMWDITDDGTGHIDMFFKLAGPTTALLGEYDETWVKDPDNAKRMDDNAAILEATTTFSGEPLKVLRMPFPSKAQVQGGAIPRTYLNSTFVNGVNLWPIYSDDKDAEAAAEQVWKDAMPDWNHVGILADQIALYSGTIHCITRTIPLGTYAHWIAPGTCDSGKCTPADDGGYGGACSDSLPCSGPAWECDCPDCNFCGDNPQVNGCEGFCGGQSPEGCWCDDQCTQYGDCCDNINDVCQDLSNIFTACMNVQCGTDNDCGTCLPTETCNADGQCVPASDCQPDCEGKECGPDGCGGSCGSCGTGKYCADGTCQDYACQPQCEGKECGPDGCGGTCGTCDGQVCEAGTCVDAEFPQSPNAGADTCENRCGQYDPEAACQCDSECAPNGDCCDDLCDFCPDDKSCSGGGGVRPSGAKSCEGRCGEYSQTAKCQCDPDCFANGNCCKDLCDVCTDDAGLAAQCAAQEQPDATGGGQADAQNGGSPDAQAGAEADATTTGDNGASGAGTDASAPASDAGAAGGTTADAGENSGGGGGGGGCAAGRGGAGALPGLLALMMLAWVALRRRYA